MLDAALAAIRRKGYSATTVDELCAATGLSKGSFFHHFKGKEDLGLAAVQHWNDTTGALFASASYQQLADPRARLLAYIDLRAELALGELPDITCLLGTLVQETFETHPRIRDACNDGIVRHARGVADDIAAAKVLYAAKATWDPMVLAFFTQATLQGAFVLAKAQGGSRIVADCIDHLRQHVANLLGADAAPAPPRKERKP